MLFFVGSLPHDTNRSLVYYIKNGPFSPRSINNNNVRSVSVQDNNGYYRNLCIELYILLLSSLGVETLIQLSVDGHFNGIWLYWCFIPSLSQQFLSSLESSIEYTRGMFLNILRSLSLFSIYLE